MVLAEQTKVETIALTPAAANAVQGLLAERDLEGHGLRVFVKGSGCSGYQYGMALDDNFREEDLVTDCHGIKVIVDEVSIGYMRGSTVDFVEDATGGGFKVENPNELASCAPQDDAGGCSGCG